MKCNNCDKDVERIVARGLCEVCYRKDIEEKKAAICLGCEEFRPIKARGMCQKCYMRYLRHGHPKWERKKKGDETCSYCHEKPVHAKHLCNNCYARYLAHGSPERVKVKKFKPCAYCGKINWIKAHGLCGACYKYQKENGTLVRNPKVNRIRECAICGKKRKIVSKGICKICYLRFYFSGKFTAKTGKYADINPSDFGLEIPTKEKIAVRRQRRNKKNRELRKNNRDRYKHHDLMKTFGITLGKYQRMLKFQNGVCAICGKFETARRNGRTLNLAVDHNHKTGKIRALLCQNCNHGIGHFKDSPELLNKVIEFLNNHQ